MEWNGIIHSGKRIEIDSVLKAVGNETFWNYIIKELDANFLDRDYNRSIEVPEYVPQKEVDDLFTNIKNIIIKVQAEEWERIKNELKNVKRFLDVKPKERDWRKIKGFCWRQLRCKKQNIWWN